MVRQAKRATRASKFTYPKTFAARQIPTNGTKLYVRVGGSGPAVVLLHGYGETGDMWVPLANDLARDHVVVVPDLRGMGLSTKPRGGYAQKVLLAPSCDRIMLAFEQANAKRHERND
jgi:pimeloyl-ACP methyl ester carboxylesterase